MHEIQIKNKTYKLSKRLAVDVLDLQDSFNKINNETESLSFTIMSKIIIDSLRATRLSLPFYKKLKYNKFDKRGATIFIMSNLSIDEVLKYYYKVLEVENYKKKDLTQQANESEDKLRQVL